METIAQPIDVAIIGAGLAGLVSAQILSQAGYQIVVVEKSRGLGGRVATRRLQDTSADHGVRSLTVQGPLSEQLIQTLQQQQMLQPWSKPLYQAEQGTWCATKTLPYGSPTGLNTTAKFLARDLEIWRNQRVEAVLPQSQGLSQLKRLSQSNQWQLQLSGADPAQLLARALVVAIPAPQALQLLEPLQPQGFPDQILTALQRVEFDPCITVIAIYEPERQTAWNALPWQALQFSDSDDLAWLSLETSKYASSQHSVAVIHSTGSFAQQWLDATDLQAVGQMLIQQAANWVPALNQPLELQVHRWRYAFVRQPWPQTDLSTTLPLPISCSGDWCGGQTIESALTAGLEAGLRIDQMLNHRIQTVQTRETRFAELLKPLTQQIS